MTWQDLGGSLHLPVLKHKVGNPSPHRGIPDFIYTRLVAACSAFCFGFSGASVFVSAFVQL